MIGGRTVDALALSEAQPLAHRLLGRVLVSCPLADRHGCPWKGDYGNLQDDLVSASAHLQAEAGARDDAAVPDERKPQEPAQRGVRSVDTPHEGAAIVPMEIDNPTPETGENGCLKEENLKRRSLAESFKAEANGKFSSGNYREAMDLYSKALSVLGGQPGDLGGEDAALAAALRSNRAATHLKLGDLEGCVRDCDSAVALDGAYVKAYVRRSKALLELGRFNQAVISLSPPTGEEGRGDFWNLSALKTERRRAVALRDGMIRGTKELMREEYLAAKSTFGAILRETGANRVVAAAARGDLGLGLTDSALRLSLRVIRSNSRDAEGFEIRGRCLYLMGDMDGAVPLLREAIRLDPDCEGAKIAIRLCRSVSDGMKKARAAVFRRDFSEASELFKVALDAANPLPRKAPLYCTLHAERAESFLRLKMYKEALQESALALQGSDDHVRAWLVKTKAYHGLGRHQDALNELEKIMGTWGAGNASIRDAHEKAEFEVRKIARPDYYKLFGVSAIASEMEIKKQYKVKAMELHPDRLSADKFTDDDRKVAEEKFKLLGEGLETLCNEFSRELYDKGYDPDAIRERVSAAQQAAHRKGGHYHHR